MSPTAPHPRVAYLVNAYPRTSHSFIRREILAMERLGVRVSRYSLRPLEEGLVNAEDHREHARTRVVLDTGALGMGLSLLAAALRRPRAFARAIALALRVGRGSDRGLLRHLVYLAEAAVLERWLRAEAAEHLHAHFGTNSAAVAMLCRALGGPPYSFTAHGSEIDTAEVIRIGEKIRHAAFAVAVCDYGRAQLRRWARDEDAPRIHVVRTGLGEELLRAPPSPVPPRPRLVCVARLVRLKGHPVLLEAAAELAREGLRFELVLVGDGPSRARLAALAGELGLRDHVRFAGWMSEEQVRDAILGSRALVLPSLTEGLPVVVMEALALGRPVIATAITGVPELVEPGVTGWLVPAGSPEHLARAMREALESAPARLERMGRAGSALVRLRHDATDQARQLLSLISGESAVAGPRAARPASAAGQRTALRQ